MPYYLRRHDKVLNGVETCCLFLGYPRSGHSLIGSFLDAHPEALIAHRLNAAKYFAKGMRLRQVLMLMIRNSERFAATGRALTAYSYPIVNQWQGRYQRLRLVGDQEGNHTARILGESPELITHFQAGSSLRFRLLHVVRNPYDNIATWALRSFSSLPDMANVYFARCQAIATVKDALSSSMMLDIHHEMTLQDPAYQIRRLLNFLDLPEIEGYIDACVGIVNSSPNRSRHNVTWPSSLRRDIQNRIDEIPWLANYRYES